MMLKDGTEDGTGEVEDGTAKTGVVKNKDGRCLLVSIIIITLRLLSLAWFCVKLV